MQFRDDDQKVKKVGVGCYFSTYREKYILAQVLPSKVCLIGLQSGNRKTEAVEVQDVTYLSRSEFLEVCGEHAQEIKMIDEQKIIAALQ